MKLGTVLAIVIVVAAIGFYTGIISYNNGHVNVTINSSTYSLAGVGQGGTSTSSCVATSTANLPLQVTVTNKLAGGQGAGTVNIWNAAGTTKLDSGSLSSGSYTSLVGYTPCEALNVQLVNSNSKEWYQVTVPTVSSVQSSSTVYTANLNFFTLGTFAVAFSDQLGNTYSSGACFNMTAIVASVAQCGGGAADAKPGTSPAQLYIALTNSVPNTGYTTSYDPVNMITDNALLVVQGAGAASITGCGQTFNRGGTFYCVTQLGDANLSCQTVGQSINCGTSRTALTLSPGTIAKAASETETVTMYSYANANNFLTLGSWGPDVVSSATATIKAAY